MKFVRTNIGACAHSVRPYTYDDGAEDQSLENFALTSEDTELKMPMMSAILGINPDVEMIGSLFSGPDWMKTSDLKNSGTLLRSEFKAATDYLVKYVDAWTAKGFKIWGITPLNEPIWGMVHDVGYPTTGWLARGFTRWLTTSLGPTFMEKHPGLQLIQNENSRLYSSFFLLVEQDYMNAFDPNTTLDNIWHYGMHWYNSGTPNFWIRVPEIATKMHPMGTEAMHRVEPTNSASQLLGSWDIAEDYAYTIIDDLNGNYSAWIDWNMVLNSEGGPSWVGDYATSAMQTDASDNDVFYKNPIYYALGHFSRFIEPGWTIVNSRIDSNGYKHLSLVVAEGGNNEKVAVVQNRNNDPVDVNYFDVDMRKEVQFTLNANSITTLYYSTE